MSILTPEPRMDRNGKVVTRHVKAEAPSPKKGSIPAPTAGEKTPEGLMLGETLIELSYSANGGVIDGSEIQGAQKARRLPNRTARLLNDMLDSSADKVSAAKVVRAALVKDDDSDTLENIATFYSDYIYQELGDEADGTPAAYTMLIGDINGLKKYPQFPTMENYSESDPQTIETVKALFLLNYEADKEGKYRCVEETVNGVTKPCNYIDDPKFVDVVLKYATSKESTDFMADYVYDNGMDAERLENVMSTSSPLRDGVL